MNAKLYVVAGDVLRHLVRLSHHKLLPLRSPS
jgi:hypothetical protein